jgi:hypothetical protein
VRTLQKQKGPGEWLRGAFVDRASGGCMDAHPAGAVGVRVRCSGNGSLIALSAREVDRHRAW